MVAIAKPDNCFLWELWVTEPGTIVFVELSIVRLHIFKGMYYFFRYSSDFQDFNLIVMKISN